MEGKTLVGGQKAWCGSLPVQDAGSDFFAIGSAPSLTANEIIVVSNSGRGSPIEIYRAAWEKWSPSVKRVKPQAASHCGGAISLGTMRRRGAPSNIYPIELFRDWELSVMRLARDESLLGIVIFSEIGYLVTLSAERVNVTLNCKENETEMENQFFVSSEIVCRIIIGALTGSVNLSSYHVVATKIVRSTSSDLYGKIDSLLVYEVYFLGKQRF